MPVPPAGSGPVFPVAPIPHNVSAKNPVTCVIWAQFVPIGSSSGLFTKNLLPYAENYELSIQRQITSSDLLTVSYVGTQGHRLLSTLESNPGNPALCLSIPTCGPGGESTVYTLASGQVTNGTLGPFGFNFATNGYLSTISNTLSNHS